jgi:hypothetical protein
VSPGDNTAPVYAAEQQVEHLVLYYKNFIGVVTLLDIGDSDPGLAATQIPLPSGVSDARLAHIDWDPTQAGASDWRRLTNVVLASGETQSNGDVEYSLFMMNQAANTSASNQEFFTPLVMYTKVTFANNWKQRNVTIAASALQNGDLALDYSSLRSVLGLHTTIVDGNWYHVKLANFEGRGVCLLTIIKEGPPDEIKSIPPFFLGGHFPLAFPDAAGLGTINVLSGGTSKFGGFRYVASDADGNVFMMRQITNQILPQGPALHETGDHYQATVTPANAYGKTVSLLSDENANLLIEVRADSPCTVIDDTNNQYYDIDRYTSFMAAPDPASGRLCLLVKAETFSQVLYVRLVDTSGLQPSSDAAMLSSADSDVYPWQSVNLASYFNTSGQNLISATGQLSLGASVDGVTIDPLYALTAVPVDSSRPTVKTQFAYNTGSVTTTLSAPSTMLNSQLGSIFSSISHALHDALHWLQHVEGDAYKDLASGGVSLVSAVDSITVTVGKDIMKQVNGVEQELDEVVSTVEEYASVVANLVVTIVESTFIYKFIEIIITLISLFLHFEDVLSLSNSFKGLIDDILSGSNGESIPQIPSSFSSWDIAGGYLGPGNTFSQAFGGVDSNNVGSELIQGLLDAILGNPLIKKILNKIMSAISSLLNEALPTPPLSFNMDQSAAQGVMDDITNLVDNLEQGVAQMTEQTATVLIQQLAAVAADPQQTYRNLGSGLGSLAEEIASDFITPVFDFVDEVTTGAPAYARDMIDYSQYITFDTAVLADLCKLFGIGSVSNTKLTLKASEAVFFPLALIAWVAVYTHDGRSISSVGDLDATFSTSPGTVGAASPTLWNLVRLAADGALTEFGGFVWFLTAAASKNGSTSTAVKSIAHAGAWLNWIRWMSDFVYTCRNWNPATGQPWDYANVAIRLTTASADLVFTLPDLSLNPGTGWPTSPRPTDMSQVINVLVTLVSMGADTYWVAESNPDTNQIISIAGQDFARSQGIATFLYNLFSLKDYLAYFTAYVLVCPFGFEMQVLALSGVLESPGQPGTPPGKRRRRRRRRRQRHRRPEYRDRRIGRYR